MAAVDWDLAERVAVRVSAPKDPFADSYHYDSLAPDFEELTAIAEEQVADDHRPAQPRRPGPGPGHRPHRLGLRQHRLVPAPAAARSPTGSTSGCRPRRSRPVARRVAGAEVGVLLGWMSSRVLGQYDLLVIEDEDPEDQDIVYYVGPNVLALEKRFAFPPREFRLWLALHEVTHRAQFTGIPWMREHFLGLVESTRRRGRPRPEAAHRRDRPRSPTSIRNGRQPARRRRHRRPVLVARAARGARAGQRAHEPARGPRRRDHGPGRRRPDPVGRPLRTGAAPAPPAGQRRWPSCCRS